VPQRKPFSNSASWASVNAGFFICPIDRCAYFMREQRNEIYLI
jgi:hypothetical protein